LGAGHEGRPKFQLIGKRAMRTTGASGAWPNWQDEHAYVYCEQLTGLGWAWEFLRRNPLFLKDITLVSHRFESSRSRQKTITRLAAPVVDLSSWCLIFCNLLCQ
jgi:hypothetical protein